jgi:hypothetical protein
MLKKIYPHYSWFVNFILVFFLLGVVLYFSIHNTLREAFGVDDYIPITISKEALLEKYSVLDEANMIDRKTAEKMNDASETRRPKDMDYTSMIQYIHKDDADAFLNDGGSRGFLSDEEVNFLLEEIIVFLKSEKNTHYSDAKRQLRKNESLWRDQNISSEMKNRIQYTPIRYIMFGNHQHELFHMGNATAYLFDGKKRTDSFIMKLHENTASDMSTTGYTGGYTIPSGQFKGTVLKCMNNQLVHHSEDEDKKVSNENIQSYLPNFQYVDDGSGSACNPCDIRCRFRVDGQKESVSPMLASLWGNNLTCDSQCIMSNQTMKMNAKLNRIESSLANMKSTSKTK